MNCIESKILGCHAVSTFLLATKALQLSIYCCEDPLDSFHNFKQSSIVFLQMVCSCCFLYLLRCWRMISFSTGESLHISDNSTKFVSLLICYCLDICCFKLLFLFLVVCENRWRQSCRALSHGSRNSNIFLLSIFIFFLYILYIANLIFLL